MTRGTMYHMRDTFPQLIELYDKAAAQPHIPKLRLCKDANFPYITFMGFCTAMSERPDLVKEVRRYKEVQARAAAAPLR